MEWDDPAHEINRGLLYRRDNRTDPDPDDERLSVFKRGWREAVSADAEDFGDRAFETLSWRNLGYRLGLLFGETPSDLQEELYEWCVAQMRA